MPPKKKGAKKRAKKRGKNPVVRTRPVLCGIYAKGTGRKMHFDGAKFSESGRLKQFATAADAERKAQALIAQYPILRKYRVTVESNFR